MSEKLICKIGNKCEHRRICSHSTPHECLKGCPIICSSSVYGFVKCIEYNIEATGEEVLNGLFPIIKK